MWYSVVYTGTVCVSRNTKQIKCTQLFRCHGYYRRVGTILDASRVWVCPRVCVSHKIARSTSSIDHTQWHTVHFTGTRVWQPVVPRTVDFLVTAPVVDRPALFCVAFLFFLRTNFSIQIFENHESYVRRNLCEYSSGKIRCYYAAVTLGVCSSHPRGFPQITEKLKSWEHWIGVPSLNDKNSFSWKLVSRSWRNFHTE